MKSFWPFRKRKPLTVLSLERATETMPASRITPVYVAKGTSPTERSDIRTGDFLTSYVIAQVTDSAAMGYVAGGDLVGAILGDMANSEPAATPDPPSCSTDYSSGCDSSGSDFGGGME